MKQCLYNFIQMKGLCAKSQIYSCIYFEEAKATSTYFISKGVLQGYVILCVFPHGIQTLIFCFRCVFQEKVLVEHDFLYSVHYM